MGLYHLFAFILGAFGFAYVLFKWNKPKKPNPPLPPGSYGWPFAGETMDYLRCSRSGHPGQFIHTRITKYGKEIFKTSLFGKRTIFFNGSAGNKLLFASENKLVLTCWPPSIKKLFGDSFIMYVGEEAMRKRKMVTAFLKPEVLNRFIGRFDGVSKQRIETEWEGKEQVSGFSLIRSYAFSIACIMFASIDDPNRESELLEQFDVFVKGVLQLPIYFPGTRHYRAVRSATVLRRELLKEINRKRRAVEEGEEEEEDLMSFLMGAEDEEDGRSMGDKEIVDNILNLMYAGHDTSSSTMMMVLKYLAEMPHFYDCVFQEQREIALSKGPGEPLNKEDIQKMKYSWNVVNEVLRIASPVQGSYRKTITEFTYAGFTIPKDWQASWNVYSTHKYPEYFPEPERFDPSRFEGDGPAPYTFVPFGGGPRMCPGREYARVEILVFLHNLVNRFKWELVYPDEHISFDPMPCPSKGLQLYLYPHPLC